MKKQEIQKSRVTFYQEQCSKEKTKLFQDYTAERNDILEMQELSQREKSALCSALVATYNKMVVEIQEKYRKLVNH